ncbi:hypothetical protein KL950_003978 [Ogataea haglerorum]|nr:hypothetical protein KL950_003978 [Ogataea haglerorum]
MLWMLYSKKSDTIRDDPFRASLERRTRLTKDTRLQKIKKDAVRIARYRALTDRVLDNKQNRVYNGKTLAQTEELLDINPELYTVWNYRRDILLEQFKTCDSDAIHDIIKNELALSVEHLRRFPKCYWIWNHRKWCLEYDPLTNWDAEMAMIDTFLKADSRNYHVWQYRRYVVDRMKLGQTSQEQLDTDLQEFNYTTKMINRDISNYSALHNRSRLVKMLFENSPESATVFHTKNKYEFLVQELQMVKTAFYTDPDDSSVWIYLKWLLGDYFIGSISTEQARQVVETAIADINELNQLELEDNGVDNQWCLKSLVFLEQQLAKATGVQSGRKNAILKKLIEQDPMRIKRYENSMD